MNGIARTLQVDRTREDEAVEGQCGMKHQPLVLLLSDDSSSWKKGEWKVDRLVSPSNKQSGEVSIVLGHDDPPPSLKDLNDQPRKPAPVNWI